MEIEKKNEELELEIGEYEFFPYEDKDEKESADDILEEFKRMLANLENNDEKIADEN